jgi:hypothetical protein
LQDRLAVHDRVWRCGHSAAATGARGDVGLAEAAGGAP